MVKGLKLLPIELDVISVKPPTFCDFREDFRFANPIHCLNIGKYWGIAKLFYTHKTLSLYKSRNKVVSKCKCFTECWHLKKNLFGHITKYDRGTVKTDTR